jgi:hypothetical protein
MTTTDISDRFAADTAEHTMTVLHDDGLYRHLRFQRTWWQPPLARQQTSGMYRFDLITVPGTLIFQGDGDSFVFSRIEDMFDFFRSNPDRKTHQINPRYWSEKLTSGRDKVMKYDQETFEARVKEAFVDAARYGGVPAGTGKALRRDVLEADTYYEQGAREALDTFEHEGFRFHDTWEWSFKDYDWWFLWACHGIVWGIAQYDASRVAASPVMAEAVSQ